RLTRAGITEQTKDLRSTIRPGSGFEPVSNQFEGFVLVRGKLRHAGKSVVHAGCWRKNKNRTQFFRSLDYFPAAYAPAHCPLRCTMFNVAAFSATEFCMARDQTDMTPIETRDELVAWLEAGCKPKELFRVGTEHEKFAFTVADHRPVPYS